MLGAVLSPLGTGSAGWVFLIIAAVMSAAVLTLARLPGAHLVLLVALGVASAGLGALEARVEVPPELARVLTDYEAAWGAKDAAALAALFAEDGYVLASGGPAVRGRDAIRSHYTGAGGPLFLRAFAYATEGSVGYILGGYRGRQDMPEDEGKFTLTLRKTSDGTWKIVSDMDNMNSRPR